ncbi:MULTISPECIES: RNase adapter RapZ [unclassified Halanaerobium]|uniref:RNase adapter RapZ n=1 Tax=unclassified Halanaerobium TaxID=2641197 RepID=UPI000DF226B5|nr:MULTISPECIES: RNase adapter RapZ [unclassified Halanaerobium]RCW45691.1 UPF0042 nucleotide-binding protein [Halanaerobium sp. MA284_MarDTE_T2]RCW88063.1 UPF0042 nucleotide-binding protein [Halanaerobium sp. DL-01]
MNFFIITGMSGAGKSVALNYFEDKGYFCVDNLPPALISKFAELCSKSEMNKIALVSDIRGREFFTELFEELSKLEELQIDYDILFLEASDEVLIRRYKKSRRRHPLDQQGRILEAIKRERKILEELKGRAAETIDTSNLDIKEFYKNLSRLLNFEENSKEYLPITLLSFGFKYGLPRDADLVFDVRFLPNPHYISSLKNHTGEEKVVRDYVLKWPVTQKFLQKFYALLDFLLPEYRKEGKSHLTIAIGCTGGKHRSVTTVVKLAERLKKMDYKINIDHRDLDK